MKITTKYSEKFLVTRYQTVKLDPVALEMAQAILEKTVITEKDLIQHFAERVEEREVRLFISRMLQVKAIDII